MNDAELTLLLGRMQVVDNRQIGVATIEAWRPIVGDLRLDDCIRAMNEHYATSGEYLAPHHLVTAARLYEERRAQDARRLMERGNPDEIGVPKPPYAARMEAAALAATKQSIAAGHGGGSDVTKRSAFAAAEAVQLEWESTNGKWDDVWDKFDPDNEPF